MYYPHNYSAINANAATQNSSGDWVATPGSAASPLTGTCRYEASGGHNQDTIVIDGVVVSPAGVIYTKKNAALQRGQVITVTDNAGVTLVAGKILQVSTGLFNQRLWV